MSELSDIMNVDMYLDLLFLMLNQQRCFLKYSIKIIFLISTGRDDVQMFENYFWPLFLSRLPSRILKSVNTNTKTLYTGE